VVPANGRDLESLSRRTTAGNTGAGELAAVPVGQREPQPDLVVDHNPRSRVWLPDDFRPPGPTYASYPFGGGAADDTPQPMAGPTARTVAPMDRQSERFTDDTHA
jgi:hypothetical protein